MQALRTGEEAPLDFLFLFPDDSFVTAGDARASMSSVCKDTFGSIQVWIVCVGDREYFRTKVEGRGKY